jgi:flagellar protein FlaG
MNIGSTFKPIDPPAAPVARGSTVERTPKPGSTPESAEDSQSVASQPVDRARVEQAAAVLQEFAQSVRRDINFRVDDGSGQLVVKVTDPQSGNLIRQIPSEEALQIAENLDAVRSKLFSAEV